MSFGQLLKNVKENNQDFEWYPTDTKILDEIKNRINKYRYEERYGRQTKTLLDIGAGNGKVLNYFSQENLKFTCYGIEKSSILMNEWNKYYYLLGCDFYKTTLLDKKVDITFCNPPYKEFEEWATRIIRESCSILIYLVLPKRWINCQSILNIITERKAEYNVIYSFDFNEAEDRTARAQVDVIEVRLREYDPTGNPFSKFFDENFNYPQKPINLDLEKKIENTQLIHNTNLIETLDFLYQERMKELQDSYKAVCALAYDLLKEFELTKESLIKSLEMKINGAKKEYWQRLFDGMKTINSRLTKSSRQSIVEIMNAHTGIEFNRENAYAIVIWVIKNCNDYFDAQFLETYDKMISLANIESYKSNQRVFTKDQFCYWNKYEKRGAEYYKLKTGNRIVLEHCGGICTTKNSWSHGLQQCAQDFIEDLLVIARNLDFIPEEFHGHNYSTWDDSGARSFYCTYKDDRKLLFSVRAYQNQNMHFSFDNDFIHVLNITHGRLRGWINDKQTAEKEATKETSDYFDFDCKIKENQLMLK